MRVDTTLIQQNQNNITNANDNNKSTSAAEHAMWSSGYSIDLKGSDRGFFSYEEHNRSANDVLLDADTEQLMNRKNYMVVMSNTLSEEDFSKLQQEGYQPGNMTSEEIVTILDEIKATMAKSGTVVAGYNDDMDASLLKEITGSEVYARALQNSFEKHHLPATQKNIEEALSAVKLGERLTPLTDSEKQYLVENHQLPTLENIYVAKHSGSSSAGSSSGSYFSDIGGYVGKKAELPAMELMKDQLTQIITSSGYEASEENVKLAYGMVRDGMLLTADSFSRMKELSGIPLPLTTEELADFVVQSMKEGIPGKQTNLLHTTDSLTTAVQLTDMVNEITDEAVDYTLSANQTLNIRNLYAAQQALHEHMSTESVSAEASLPTDTITKAEQSALTVSEESVTAKRQLAEIRLQMTVSATYVLIKNNISVDTRELSLLVEDLKEAENRQFEILFGHKPVEEQKNLHSLYRETMEKTGASPGLPVSVVGVMSMRSSFSLNIVYEEGTLLRERYRSAGKSYEALMTAPRKDLGDSIQKAFRNVDDVLSEQNLEINDDNRRAVRILGYNRMEINEESVANINKTYQAVKDVIDKMTPGKTLQLIRDGINPLTVSMEELERHLTDIPSDPVAEAERYSHFLYRMEEHGQITAEEKESYIGIYRLIHQIEKRDGAAVGALINGNAEINFKNLLSAVRSYKDRGMDITLDSEFGEAEQLIQKGISISEQIATAFKDTKDQKQSYDEQTSYNREQLETIRNIQNIGNDVVTMLLQNNLPLTVDNLIAANALVTNRGNLFNKAKSAALSDLTLDDKEERLARSSEDSTEILLDDESLANKFERSVKNLQEHFDGPLNAKSAYENMAQQITDIFTTRLEQTDNRIDVKEIIQAMKQTGVSLALAKEENYQIPMQIGEEYTSVFVKIRHEKEMHGSVSITLDTAYYGKVLASFTYQESALNGYIAGTSPEGLSFLKEKQQSFLDAANEAGLPFGKINFIQSDSVNINNFTNKTDEYSKNSSNGFEAENDKDGITTKSLYMTAKIFIQTYSF